MTLPDVLIPVRKPDGHFEVFEADPIALEWPELQKIWTEHRITLPLCFAPPEEKLELFFYYACRTYGVPASLGAVYNPGWTDMFMATGGHDCLVASGSLTSHFISNDLFADRIVHLTLLIIVGDPSKSELERLSAMYPSLSITTVENPASHLRSPDSS